MLLVTSYIFMFRKGSSINSWEKLNKKIKGDSDILSQYPRVKYW